jgi:hypothetical protein
MKNIKKHFLPLVLMIALASSLSSCMTTKTSVGAYQEIQGSEYTYAKGKQLWLFWGILPLGRTDVRTPIDGNCQVVTKFTFLDFLVSGLTGGLVASYSIKVKAKRAI